MSIKIWGPRPARLCLAGRRYASGLASLLGPSLFRFAQKLGLACGPPFAALGRSTVFFLLAILLWQLGSLGPWAEALVCCLLRLVWPLLFQPTAIQRSGSSIHEGFNPHSSIIAKQYHFAVGFNLQ